ncbi:Por secretion system C-terminal sorting domain-containing protein [Bizionia echini]|uniref:Por secretion system C-terminal sorting domain-containing protein n=1 Tax=Bizionia echini TaxID=649333 RepID=A0A1I5CVX6_9FLAO|nr:T9SS type A sorting domain-containing protein [Bizionia echini]SFN91083.1 Por secretion system C-terminal sorting domain-containing protein [Bizionia echini]
MKTRLLIFFYLTTFSFVHAQVPSDYIGKYNFDNGSLADEVNGIGDLINPTGQPSNYSVTDGWDNLTNSAIDVTNVLFVTGAYPQIAQEYAYSFWINTTSNISNNRDIFKRLNNNQSNTFFMQSGGITIQLEDGKVKGYVMPILNGTAGILGSVETNVISDGNWHHVVISIKRITSGAFKGWEIEAFQDGTLISTDQTNLYPTSQNPSITTSNQSLFVGSNAQSFVGKIDDIRIFERELSLQEVIATQNDPGYVNFTDSNFKSWFVNNPLINTNGSSEIEYTEALAYTGSVMTTNLNVTDITGIEEFTNVTAIDVSNNQITSADFSKNSNLTSLNVSSNSLVTFNLQNGNNTLISTYNSTNNPNLTCVLVDDFNYANTNWTLKDAQTNYSSTCNNSQVYVAPDATGANNGTSWSNAYTNLQTALTNNPSSTFWLKAGFYVPGTSRTDSFIVTSDQTVYGGFNGTEIDVSQRNPDVNETILSGDINSNDNGVLQHNIPAYADNTYQIIQVSGDNVVLDGLTIKGGNAASSSSNDLRFGAAITIGQLAKNITFNRLLIEDNRVNNAGVVYFGHTSAQTGNYNYYFTNCIFRNNLGRFATVYYASNPRTSGTAKTTFVNSVFYDNIVADVPAYSNGTNTLIWFRSDISTTHIGEIINCTISSNDFNATNNNASIISASRINGSCTARLYNSIVWDNKRASDNNEHVTLGTFNTQAVASRDVQHSIAPNFASGIAQNSSTTNPILSVGQTSNKYKFQIANASSNAINFGNNALLQSSITNDLLNNNRIINTTVDAGAYEFDSTLSSEYFETNNEFVVYPNPTESTINIKMNTKLKQVTIYNMLGAEVLNKNNYKIDVSSLKTGVYLIKIEDQNGKSYTKQFIKK